MRLCTSHWIATYGAGAATWDDWVGTSSCPLCGGVLQSYRSCNSGGLATSGEYLQLHNRLPWKPWRPLLERTHNCCLPRRLRRLAHKCTSPPLWTTLPHIFQIIVIAIPYFCINPAPYGPSKWQSVGLCAQCYYCASQHLQVWFLRYYGQMCLSLRMFTELPFCSALLTCPSVNIHMLWGSLW
jgi:hypothetical protein